VAISQVLNSGGGLLVLSGAGMSVTSGVPVFRMADGSMSAEFLRFLADYNEARLRSGLPKADDWFSFSVPEMFNNETAKEAWAYWRWRALRALVEPGSDYRELGRIMAHFGPDRVFVQTSNCDQLHVKAGLSSDSVFEVHGSLGRLQCAAPCSSQLWPADSAFLTRLHEEPSWVPLCPRGCGHCLRPNVMIFGDSSLVHSELDSQASRLKAFMAKFRNPSSQGDVGSHNIIVVEIGAGVVVSSIRSAAEMFGSQGAGLVRINPSPTECAERESSWPLAADRLWPLPLRSVDGLARIANSIN